MPSGRKYSLVEKRLERFVRSGIYDGAQKHPAQTSNRNIGVPGWNSSGFFRKRAPTASAGRSQWLESQDAIVGIFPS